LISRASFIALRHRNFRLIWIGLLVSLTGSTMQSAAHAVARVAAGAARAEGPGARRGRRGQSGPIIVFSLISGVVADALDRRRLMLARRVLSHAGGARARALAFPGVTHVWPIYLLAALGSAVSAFDLPARQALVPTLVPREHLPNAISLNTIMFQIAAVLGPSLGGVLIAASGVGWAYVANASRSCSSRWRS
jgi:MFS family permease